MMWAKFVAQLDRQQDAASLAVVRMTTAAALLALATAVLATGRVTELFMSLSVRFHYPLADFIRPLPGNLPYAHMAVIAATALAVLVGWRTKLNSVILCVATVYWFLLDPLYYSDGYYLLTLMSILVAWLPVNRWMSADRQLGRETRGTVFGWQIWLVRMQMFCVLFFSGLAKLNGDWLSGAPLVERFALAGSPVGGAALAIAWSVMLLQLSLGFLLWWRRSRVIGLILLTLLQAADALWLHIGPAPVLVWALCLIFCEPDWPRNIIAKLAPAVQKLPGAAAAWHGLRRTGSAVDAAFAWFDDSPVFKKRSPARRRGTAAPAKPQRDTGMSEAAKYAVAAWLTLQIVLPLRHYVYPGNSRWSDEGRLFAWWGDTAEKHVRLNLSLYLPDRQLVWSMNPRSAFPVPLEIAYPQQEMESRHLTGGMLQDIVMAADDEEMQEIVRARIEAANLTDEDVRLLDDATYEIVKLRLTDAEFRAIGRHPELLRQYCHIVADAVASIDRHHRRPRIEVNGTASLNGREWETYIRDESELSSEPFSLAAFRWIAPLEKSLPDADARIAFLDQQRDSNLSRTVESAPSGDKPKEKEPVLAPGISAEDEEWFQASFRGSDDEDE